MKISPMLLCLLLLGCKPDSSQDMQKDVEKMFEMLECPMNSQPVSDSN